jgi:2,4-dichlorophenol 6-monooxygenase
VTKVDTDVLVVGAGPAGLTAALALARLGVEVRMVTRHGWLADAPRAHITNQRAMEVFRDLGVESEVGRYATPWELMGDTVIATSLAGKELGRLGAWGRGDARYGEYLLGSPSELCDVAQPYLEAVLLRNAASSGADVAFHTEYVSHEQHDDRVAATLRSRLDGEERKVTARYLIGADGARSQVAEDLGLPIEGTHGRAATVYTEFEADLSGYVEHRAGVLYWIVRPATSHGEIGMGVLRAVRTWDRWIAGWGIPVPSTGSPVAPPVEEIETVIRSLVGDPGLEPQIQRISTWGVNEAFATAYSRGRAFCIGDAVHRHPPSGGLGSNTSVQDAANLAWKLAYVLRGDAGLGLLETYSAERVPVGRQVVERANLSRKEFGSLNQVLAGGEDPVAVLATPGEEGAALRERWIMALRQKNYEFNAQGIEMNQRYDSTAVLTAPEEAEEAWERDRQLHLQATTRPGAKLPHVWLVDQHGRRLSTLDVVGGGHFTLLTGIAGAAWVEGALELDLDLLRTIVVGGDVLDPYGDWAGVREVEEAGAILVRPDGHVAWRSHSSARDGADARQRLGAALASILDTALP